MSTGAHTARGIQAPAGRESTAETGQAGKGGGWQRASWQHRPQVGMDRPQTGTDRHTWICCPGSSACAVAQGELDGTKQHQPIPTVAPAPAQSVTGQTRQGWGRWLQEGDSSLAAWQCSTSLLGPVLASAFWGCRCLSHGSSAPLALPFLKKPWVPGLDFPELVVSTRVSGLGRLLGAQQSEGQRCWQPHSLPRELEVMTGNALGP